MRYFAEIKRSDAGYVATVHQGNPAFARPLFPVRLEPEVTISISGQIYSLGTLVHALIDYHPDQPADWEAERGQIEIGHYLYQQLFGNTHPSTFTRPPDDRVDLRIITDDEHIARLPWVLLAHQGLFLSASGWSVALAQTYAVRDVLLPASPRMLIIAPEPAGMPRTHASTHLEALEYHLSLYDHHLSRDGNLRVVESWG